MNNLLSVEEAWAKITTLARPLPVELRLLDKAQGYVLAEQISAASDLPPFDNSAMDGYALRSADTAGSSIDNPVRLSIVGEVAAGAFRDEPVHPGTAVKIMTGAAIPPGADTVLMLEDGRARGNHVEVRQPISPGKHVRVRGEDVRKDEVLFNAGVRLNSQMLGLLASNGIAQIRVHRSPSIGVLATGSELICAGTPLKSGQIHDSNRLVLRSLLKRAETRVVDLGIVADDPIAISERVREGLRLDVLIISGGVSVGEHDHVKEVLRQLNVETVFWRVNMKPGKPIFCGRLGERWIFGLPGNPISCVVGFLVFVEPLIRRLQGELSSKPRYRLSRLGRSIQKTDARAAFMTALAEPCSDGMLRVSPTEQQGSAMMKALALANAFIVVPANRAEINEGELVDALLIDDI